MSDHSNSLRVKLSEEQFRVTQEKGTERPFSGRYHDHFENGEYHCICCGEVLFSSKHKYDAYCGWPSFDSAADNTNIEQHDDYSHNMHRIEVTCSNCSAHLGHLFNDGPTEKGLRYCINSASLDFVKDAE